MSYGGNVVVVVVGRGHRDQGQGLCETDTWSLV